MTIIASAALLAAVRELAREAGAAILEVYRGDFEAARKDDGTPVTVADTAAEAIIVPALRRLTPDVPVVSEEEASAGAAPVRIGAAFWLVDPLDGTREFLKRNDEFTVNIGLIEDGVPTLGVLYAPALDLLYAAAGPGTATVEDAGTARAIACRTAPADGLDVMISRSHARNEKLDAWFTQAGVTVRTRVAAGSALKFGRIAAGEADLYPRLGPTCEWDTAAGHAILIAAGGGMEGLDGRPFAYGKHPEFLNPGFVAHGRR